MGIAAGSSTSDTTTRCGGVRTAHATMPLRASPTVARYGGGSPTEAGASSDDPMIPRIRLCSASRAASHGPAASWNDAKVS